MNKTSFAILSLASLLSANSAILLATPASFAREIKEQTVQAVPQTVALSGNFMAAESPTEGMARIVVENGQRYLEFDRAFSTSEGPDLIVLLHRSEHPESYSEAEAINLGRLQRLSGSQRYAIPDTANLDDYRSIAIWCRKFSVTIGYAPLMQAAATESAPCTDV